NCSGSTPAIPRAVLPEQFAPPEPFGSWGRELFREHGAGDRRRRAIELLDRCYLRRGAVPDVEDAVIKVATARHPRVHDTLVGCDRHPPHRWLNRRITISEHRRKPVVGFRRGRDPDNGPVVGDAEEKRSAAAI